jgi:hypothetical protein
MDNYSTRKAGRVTFAGLHALAMGDVDATVSARKSWRWT